MASSTFCWVIGGVDGWKATYRTTAARTTAIPATNGPKAPERGPRRPPGPPRARAEARRCIGRPSSRWWRYLGHRLGLEIGWFRLSPSGRERPSGHHRRREIRLGRAPGRWRPGSLPRVAEDRSPVYGRSGAPAQGPRPTRPAHLCPARGRRPTGRPSPAKRRRPTGRAYRPAKSPASRSHPSSGLLPVVPSTRRTS